MDDKYLFGLQESLIKMGYSIVGHTEIAYGVQFYAQKNQTKELIRVYQNAKGKITLDNSQVSDPTLKEFLSSYTSTKNQIDNEKYYIFAPPLIGTDEAGKGDYFGPLCTAAVYTDNEQYKQLQKEGIRDSKKLNDSTIADLAKKIIRICPHYSVIVVPNKVFNDHYKKVKNINAILGATHAQAIKKVLQKIECRSILIDKFGSVHWIKDQLAGYDLDLAQEIKAEQNIAVAAASILARWTFVEKIKKMSEEYQFKFPLGASAAVDIRGQEFIASHSEEELYEVAKISFKNTERILNG